MFLFFTARSEHGLFTRPGFFSCLASMSPGYYRRHAIIVCYFYLMARDDKLIVFVFKRLTPRASRVNWWSSSSLRSGAVVVIKHATSAHDTHITRARQRTIADSRSFRKHICDRGRRTYRRFGRPIQVTRFRDAAGCNLWFFFFFTIRLIYRKITIEMWCKASSNVADWYRRKVDRYA